MSQTEIYEIADDTENDAEVEIVNATEPQQVIVSGLYRGPDIEQRLSEITHSFKLHNVHDVYRKTCP